MTSESQTASDKKKKKKNSVRVRCRKSSGIELSSNGAHETKHKKDEEDFESEYKQRINVV